MGALKLEFCERHYSPELKQFLTKDPLGFAGDSLGNMYRYANNNPLIYTDPYGENPLLLPVAAGAAVGAVAGGYSAYLSGGDLSQIATGAAIGGAAGAASVVAGAAGLATAIGVGSFVGGAADVATQTLVNGTSLSDVNLTSVAASTAIGALSGGIGGFAGTRAFFQSPVIGSPIGVGAALRSEQLTGAIVGGVVGGVGTVGSGYVCQ